MCFSEPESTTMTMDVSTADRFARPAEVSQRRLAIGFLNVAHGLDHFVMLIFPMVVIELQGFYHLSYSELIMFGTASFVAFGVFSLPAGWLADRWSRRNMMVAFYIGCGVSLLGAAFAPSLYVLAGALFALGEYIKRRRKRGAEQRQPAADVKRHHMLRRLQRSASQPAGRENTRTRQMTPCRT